MATDLFCRLAMNAHQVGCVLTARVQNRSVAPIWVNKFNSFYTYRENFAALFVVPFLSRSHSLCSIEVMAILKYLCQSQMWSRKTKKKLLNCLINCCLPTASIDSLCYYLCLPIVSLSTAENRILITSRVKTDNN